MKKEDIKAGDMVKLSFYDGDDWCIAIAKFHNGKIVFDDMYSEIEANHDMDYTLSDRVYCTIEFITHIKTADEVFRELYPEYFV